VLSVAFQLHLNGPFALAEEAHRHLLATVRTHPVRVVLIALGNLDFTHAFLVEMTLAIPNTRNGAVGWFLFEAI